jgi:hypothetical protein
VKVGVFARRAPPEQNASAEINVGNDQAEDFTRPAAGANCTLEQ